MIHPAAQADAHELTAPAALSDPAVSAAPFDGSVEHDRPGVLADLMTLTKVRLNLMVLITTAVGYHMAHSTAGRASGVFNWVELLNVLVGTGLTAASSAVLNQWMEIDRDRRMPRTRNRPLPAGRISPNSALALGIALGLAGIGYLFATTNLPTALLGTLTLAVYLAIYTPLKVRSTLNTIVGAIPGAIPPVMGYTAAGAGTDPSLIALFGILFLWQMPHFLAIATLYREDYRAGGYVMLPVIDDSLAATSRQSLLYLAALLLVSLTPTLFGITGPVYAVAALLLGLAFFLAGGQMAMTRTRKDARTLFFVSIIYLPLLLGIMVFDKI